MGQEEQNSVPEGIARMAELVMSEQSVQSVLELVVELTSQTIKGADAVAITLKRNGRSDIVAGSVQGLDKLDDAQTKNGGPATQACTDGRVVVVEDLTRDERWPHFARAAKAAGYRSVLAVPLTPVLEPIGALIVYSANTREAHDVQEMATTLLAKQAAIAIANSGAYVLGEESNDQLRDALASRDIIGQAKGILMERSDLTADEAFDEMRSESQSKNRKLRDIAEEIVAKVLKRGEK